MGDAPDLSGQVAVISGAGRGIGRAIAFAYAEAGMRVVCAARSADQLDEAVATIRSNGGEAHAQVCDVTKPEEVDALFDAAVVAFGGVDLVLINAGMAGERTVVAETDIAQWRDTIDLNLVSAYTQARAAVPHLQARGGGKILFMGTGAARGARPTLSSYACAKAGVAMLNRILALEVREHNIAVNEIIPGPVRTELTGVPEEREVDDASGSPILSVAGEWIKNPSEVAPLAVFLASLPNNGPTGQAFSLVGRDLWRT